MGKTGLRSIPPPVYFCALFVLVMSILGATLVLHGIPRINDEYGYIFQAKLFISGHLYAPSPCFKEAFDFPHVINNGRWYSQYPPGFPLLLVPFVAAGVPWLVNPLFAALSILVIYFLGLELFGRRDGLLAALLGASSIWLIVISSTMMSHTTNMFFFALFMLYFFRSLRRPSFLNGLIAGASLGMSVIIHPFETAMAALPFLAYYAVKFFREFRPRLANAAGLAAGGLFFGGLFMLYNYLTNGAPFLMGHIVRYGPEHGLGFGRKGYLDHPHTPGGGLGLTGENYKAINDFLFGWPLSSLFFLLPLVIWVRRSKNKLLNLLFLASFLSLSAGLFMYWGNFVLLGARGYFAAFPILVLLSAEGVGLTMDQLPARLKIGPLAASGKAVVVAVLAGFTLYSFLIRLPVELSPHSTGRLLDNSGITEAAVFHRTWEKIDLTRSLITFNLLSSRLKEFSSGGWGPAFILNDPFLKRSLIFARAMGDRQTEFLTCYPDRRIYLYWGTFKKGCLVPLSSREGRIIHGEPLLNMGTDNSIRLVQHPEDVFLAYSNDFHEFLHGFFAGNDFMDVNAAVLRAKAEEFAKRDDHRPAAYLLEAALQVEGEVTAKYQMLGRLAILYRRLGEKREAEIIVRRLNSKRDYDVKNVLPERGF